MNPFKVIVRSNEWDQPLWIGEVVGYENFGKENQDPIPIVKDAEGKEWFCMGIVHLYAEKLFKQLQALTPKEQWDFLRNKRT